MTSAQNHWDRPEGWYERNIWRTLAALVAVAAIGFVVFSIGHNHGRPTWLETPGLVVMIVGGSAAVLHIAAIVIMLIRYNEHTGP